MSLVGNCATALFRVCSSADELRISSFVSRETDEADCVKSFAEPLPSAAAHPRPRGRWFQLQIQPEIWVSSRKMDHYISEMRYFCSPPDWARLHVFGNCWCRWWYNPNNETGMSNLLTVHQSGASRTLSLALFTLLAEMSRAATLLRALDFTRSKRLAG